MVGKNSAGVTICQDGWRPDRWLWVRIVAARVVCRVGM